MYPTLNHIYLFCPPPTIWYRLRSQIKKKKYKTFVQCEDVTIQNAIPSVWDR